MSLLILALIQGLAVFLFEKELWVGYLLCHIGFVCAV